MNKADLPHSSDWSPGSFPRDTLIYCLGSLSSTVLKAAFADSRIVNDYERWMGRPELNREDKSAGKPLLTTGIDGGFVTLIARAKADEFCLRCEHPSFCALVAFGFDVSKQALAGLFIAEFKGGIQPAIRFALDLAREVTSRVIEGQGITAFSQTAPIRN